MILAFIMCAITFFYSMKQLYKDNIIIDRQLSDTFIIVQGEDLVRNNYAIWSADRKLNIHEQYKKYYIFLKEK